VVAAADVAAMNDMLSAVISMGTGRAAELAWPVAGKTGTSQNFRDAWFVGYSADLIAGVWMGNDDGGPMAEVTGGGLPARLWRDFMAAAHEGWPSRPLPGLPARRPNPEQGFWKDLLANITGDDG
jgi:penicillin-binding protein 1A